MAVVLVVAALAFLGLSAVIGPGPESVWLRLVYTFAQWTGPLLMLAAAAWAIRRRCAEWVRNRLVDLAGPALISAMPPRTVLNSALARVFGDNVGHHEVVTALLGGSGRDPAARDTAVSKETSAAIRLERIDRSTCLTELTWTHEFSGVRNNHLLVMFATWDRDIYTWGDPGANLPVVRGLATVGRGGARPVRSWHERSSGCRNQLPRRLGLLARCSAAVRRRRGGRAA